MRRLRSTGLALVLAALSASLGCDGSSPVSATVDVEPPRPKPVPRLLTTFEGHPDKVECVAISPDGKTLASGSRKTLRFWDVASGKEQAALKVKGEFRHGSMAFSPDGRRLAGGMSWTQHVGLWDVGGLYRETLLEDDCYSGCVVAFTPNGKTLASMRYCRNKLRLWDWTTGKQTATLEGNLRGVALAFTPDGNTLASLDSWGVLEVWDVAARKRIATKQLIKSSGAVAFSPDAKTLAAEIEEDAKDGAVYRIALWDVAAGKRQITLEGQVEGVTALVFSRDGKRLAAGQGKSIKLWDVATGKELATLEGHTDEVLALAWSADGKTLASGSKDRTVKLWVVAK